ncbi:hypothetical protein PSTG_18072, partial [Puccinia striiformis f. sp. tritici PST-78]
VAQSHGRAVALCLLKARAGSRRVLTSSLVLERVRVFPRPSSSSTTPTSSVSRGLSSSGPAFGYPSEFHQVTGLRQRLFIRVRLAIQVLRSCPCIGQIEVGWAYVSAFADRVYRYPRLSPQHDTARVRIDHVHA